MKTAIETNNSLGESKTVRLTCSNIGQTLPAKERIFYIQREHYPTLISFETAVTETLIDVCSKFDHVTFFKSTEQLKSL
jgi:hypothetical protein